MQRPSEVGRDLNPPRVVTGLHQQPHMPKLREMRLGPPRRALEQSRVLLGVHPSLACNLDQREQIMLGKLRNPGHRGPRHRSHADSHRRTLHRLDRGHP